MAYFFKILSLLLLLIDGAHSIVTHQKLPRRALGTSVAAYSDILQPNASTQTFNSSQTTGFVSTSGIPSHTLIDVPTPLPSPFQGGFVDSKNYKDIVSGYCAIEDNYCSFEGSAGTGNSSTEVFTDQCLLWDTSCSGNRTLAIDEFFNSTQKFLQDNSCFSQFSSGVEPGKPDISIPVVDPESGIVDSNLVIPSDCNNFNPPIRISAWQDIKRWMRSPGCVSAQREWEKMGGKGPASIPLEITPSCCGLCDVGVDTVDLYYWPEPDMNTSCLNIVGTNVNPFTYGATTGESVELEPNTYWTCSAKTPVTSTYTQPGTSFGATETITSVYPIVTTAVVTTIGSLPIKVSLFNPWSSSPCIDPEPSPRDTNGSISSAELHIGHAIQARSHNMTVQSSTSQEYLPVSTVVLGNFTFTSPSVYANFHRVEASDWCGQTTMTSTMLSFSPGELSSIEGPFAAYTADPGAPVAAYTVAASSRTKQFNFRDLPCPPQSIMEANWYKPEPGEPYRPLVAMPAQLRQRVPWLSFCEDIVFTAYDPPTALRSATALVPMMTADSDPKIQNSPAVPSPTMYPGARKTAAGIESSSVAPFATVAQKTPSPEAYSDANESNSDRKPDSGVNKVSDTGKDPEKQENPNAAAAPVQSDPAATYSQGSNQKPSSVAHHEPNKSDNGDPTGRESGQKPAGASQLTSTEASTPADVSNPAQSILTTIAGHIITAAPTAVAIAGNTLNPGDPGVTIGGTPLALNKAGHLLLGSKIIPLASGLGEAITTTIAGKAITADPTAIAMKGTTLRAGDPGATVDGTAVALDKAGRLLIGSKRISFHTQSATSLTTTIAGQPITAAAGRLTIADTTLRPGDAGFPISGTVVSLDTAGHFVVGSKTHLFASESADLEDSMVGASGATGAFATNMPSVNQTRSAAGGNGSATSTSAQEFKGGGESLKCSLLWMKVFVVIIAMVVSSYAS